MKRVQIILTQGDWEGLYIDGKLIYQGHSLGEGDWRLFMLRMAEQYNFTSADVEEGQLEEWCDEDVTARTGRLPDSLSELEAYGEDD